MGLSALDIIVILAVGGAAVLGLMRGFVSEVLSLFAWVAIVFALKLFHSPLTHAFSGMVGTVTGAAVLAFAVLAGLTYFGGRIVANTVSGRIRDSVIGPVDRALGFGFGALKGLILTSLGFLLVVLMTDTVHGGPSHRPEWLTASKTYPLLNATSAGIADFVDRRRKGLPVFGPAAPPDNASDTPRP
jgi:membrane protein required for colicin V production